ncbi:hypothetical protein BOBR111200_07205 [Bordetella bronchialis]
MYDRLPAQPVTAHGYAMTEGRCRVLRHVDSRGARG